METGTRLGPYEILEQFGAGGMGEVWLATDTRLGRKVAIKVLPEQSASKVLDFGLAKTQEGASYSSGRTPDQTQSPTMLQATGTGMIMGTAAYMSPEQAKGKVVELHHAAPLTPLGILVVAARTAAAASAMTAPSTNGACGPSVDHSQPASRLAASNSAPLMVW